MSIAVITMVRNEADRYLRSALAAWSAFADEIIALDDGSTDATSTMLRDAGASVLAGFDEAAWGVEWPTRARLWDRALASRCDWLLWLDADMVPAANPRDLQARSVDAIAFRLYDLWLTDEHGRAWYRADRHWQAHNAPRTWMIRRPAAAPTDGWQWLERGIHCGHMPANYVASRTLVAPQTHSLLHYGYADPLDRSKKHAAYCEQAQQLSAQEFAHADSIVDDAWIGFPLPFKPLWPLRHASSSAPASVANRNSSMRIAAAYAHSTPLKLLS